LFPRARSQRQLLLDIHTGRIMVKPRRFTVRTFSLPPLDAAHQEEQLMYKMSSGNAYLE